ncbi:MAG: major facilitator superfamily 1, partial [Nocardioidaceae bacterium]|nr:major facilitator superfamily 1 [Nocardioidaceae bacterium]
MTVDERVEERLDPAVATDVRRIWQAYSVSELGTAVGNGALPLVAVIVLHASALQVAVLSALGGLAAAVLVLPLGTWLEFRRKRPVMVGMDLIRFAALLSIPVTYALGWLSFLQLV